MYICLCFGIKKEDIKDMDPKQLQIYLEEIDYFESCDGCRSTLESLSKKEVDPSKL